MAAAMSRAAAPPGGPQTPSAGERIGWRHWMIVVTVQLITLTFGLSITAANVVLPQMKGALSATPDQIAWVVTFNLVAVAVATPLTGWLAGRLGWRIFLTGSLIGFTGATAACGFANTLETLVLFRVVQGVFGAPLMPLGQGMLLSTFPPRMHPLVLMLWGVGGVMGPVLGPFLGGMVAEAMDWRWTFFMILPFGGLGLLVGWFALGNQERGTAPRLDLIGFLALAFTIGAAQLMLDRGHRLDWFDSPEIIIEAVVAVLGLYIFITHTLTTDRPFLSPALLRDRNFALGTLMAFAMGWLSYTPIVLFPPLLQDLRGYPDSLIGYLLSARGIGNFLSFMVVVPFTRYNPRLCLATGLVFQAVSGWAMAQLNINLSNFDVIWTNLLQGFGFGLAYTPLATLAFATLAPGLITQGSAVFNLMRNFGSSLFISLSVLVLVRSTAQSYAGLTEHITDYNEALRDSTASGSWSADSVSGLAQLGAEVQRQAAMVGYINAFYLFTIAAAVSVPLVLLFRRATETAPQPAPD